MKPTKIVEKMAKDYETKYGKFPTEIELAPLLYDSLKEELKQYAPLGTETGIITIRGVEIKRRSLLQ